MSVLNFTFQVVGQAVSSSRGKVFELTSKIGVGTIAGLTEVIEDFGGEVIELELFRVDQMTDIELSGVLQGALHDDKVVIAVGLNDSRCEATRRLEAYLNHGFCAQGGRAVTVRYN